MGEAARVLRPMTVEEFLEWDSGDDFVWELIDGYPRLKFAPNPDLLGQAAPSDDHQVIIGNLSRVLGNHVIAGRRPCRVIPGSGQKVKRTRERLRIPDLSVKCGASSREARDSVLVVEVNSPSNTFLEIEERGADFRSIPGLQEILFLEQRVAVATLYRRVGELWRLERVEGLDAVLTLESVGLALPLSEIYRDVLEPTPADPVAADPVAADPAEAAGPV